MLGRQGSKKLVLVVFNPILAREGQICHSKPKTLNFSQKYNQFFKRAP